MVGSYRGRCRHESIKAVDRTARRLGCKLLPRVLACEVLRDECDVCGHSWRLVALCRSSSLRLPTSGLVDHLGQLPRLVLVIRGHALISSQLVLGLCGITTFALHPIIFHNAPAEVSTEFLTLVRSSLVGVKAQQTPYCFRIRVGKVGKPEVAAPWRPATTCPCHACGRAENLPFDVSHRATRAPVGVHTTPWLFTPSTQRQRSRALLTQRDWHPRAVPTARPAGRRATHTSDPSKKRWPATWPPNGRAHRAGLRPACASWVRNR